MNISLDTKRSLIFWFLIAAVIFFLIVQVLVQDGMSLDGLIYATLAKNIAVGIGSVFTPSISDYFWPEFFEHPTLGLFLESLYFRFFGLGYLSERLYSFTTLILMLVVIYKFWNTITQAQAKMYGWLPIFFYVTLPLIFWTYTQNILENTMTLFSFISVVLIYKALKNRDSFQSLSLLILASLFIVASFFTKGPPAIFPLASIFLYFIFVRDISFQRMVYYTLILIGSFSLIMYVLLLNDAINNNITRYFNQQVLASLNGSRGSHGSRFHIVYELFFEILSITLISFIIFLTTRKKELFEKRDVKLGLFFIAVALSASLPIMLSAKQHGMYLIPSFVYFSLGFSILILPNVIYLIQKIKKPNAALFFTLTLFIVSLIFTMYKFGDYSRDEDILNDLKIISKEVAPQKIIQVDKSISKYYNINGYFMRYYDISLDAKGMHKYYLMKKGLVPKEDKEVVFSKSAIKLKTYDLYILDKI